MSTEMLLAKEKLIKAIRTCLKNNNQPPEEKSIAILRAEENLQTLSDTSNQLKQEEQDSSQYWKPPVYYSDNDDYSYRETIDENPPSDAITSDLPITDSLNLNLTPSESEDLSDYVRECDLPFRDNSLDFNNDSEIFSNPLFDSNDNYTSSDDESSSEEDVPINPLYNEVLEDLDSIPPRNENDHFNAEYDLIESLLNKDIVITSPKIDFLLEEFPPGIDEVDFDHKEDIRLTEKLLYDYSSHLPPEELNSKISIESFSPSPIPVKDSDSFMEEINTFLASEDSIPLGIDSDGYDFEEDNLFLEYEPDPGELTKVVVEDIFGEPKVHMPNVLPTYPTFCHDLDFTLSTNFSGSDIVVSFPFRNRNKTFDPGISIEVQSKRFLSLNKFSISFISDPLSPALETLLPFTSENEDKVFNPGILFLKEEKSPHLLSHRGFKAFKIIHNFLYERPMKIYRGDIPI
ncbi:hypothetical protein Tco_0537145 [Tanacetum coccineum]